MPGNQDQLWAAAARPKRLTIVVDRLWDEGDDVWAITGSLAPSKGTEGRWSFYEVHRSSIAATIVTEIAGAAIHRFQAINWAVCPHRRSTDHWEDHLTSL